MSGWSRRGRRDCSYKNLQHRPSGRKQILSRYFFFFLEADFFGVILIPFFEVDSVPLLVAMKTMNTSYSINRNHWV